MEMGDGLRELLARIDRTLAAEAAQREHELASRGDKKQTVPAGLFSTTVTMTAEAFRIEALAALYERMFERKAAGTKDGPFFRFAQAAFTALGERCPPSCSMVRRHFERHHNPRLPGEG